MRNSEQIKRLRKTFTSSRTSYPATPSTRNISVVAENRLHNEGFNGFRRGKLFARHYNTSRTSFPATASRRIVFSNLKSADITYVPGLSEENKNDSSKLEKRCIRKPVEIMDARKRETIRQENSGCMFCVECGQRISNQPGAKPEACPHRECGAEMILLNGETDVCGWKRCNNCYSFTKDQFLYCQTCGFLDEEAKAKKQRLIEEEEGRTIEERKIRINEIERQREKLGWKVVYMDLEMEKLKDEIATRSARIKQLDDLMKGTGEGTEKGFQ